MLGLTRELLTEHLLELPSLTDQYATRDPEFIAGALAWLARCESTLQRLRNPLAGMIAAERAKVIATSDGYREAGLADKGSARKALRVSASRALAAVEAELRAVVASIDGRLLAFREKMAQLLAVASAMQSLPLPNGETRDQWLSDVWETLRESKEGRSMALYLSGALHPSDRWLVLGETLENLLGPNGAN